ncbi:MAG: Calx-beta domain-containing protein [Candidatus Marithrix sp.]
MPKPFLKTIIFLIFISSIPIVLADDCAKIAQLTGGVCIVPPIADQTDPDWEKMFTNVVLNALISSIQPSIITVSPNQLPQGGTANFTLTASKTHFDNSSQIDIGGGIIIDITQVTSDTEISFNITAPINATPDYYDITINTGSEIATGIGVLRITPDSNSPEILSISPAIVSKNSTIEMQIFGNDKTNFTDSSVVKFASKQADNSFIEDTGITAQIKTVTPNLLTIIANVTATASAGLHNINVLTGTEEAIDNNELGSLRINEYDSDFAEITSITPNYASQGDTITINIAGSSVEFIDDQSIVKFGATGIEILSTTVISPTQAIAEIEIADNALLGVRDVYITTGAEIATKLDGFAIFSPVSISLNTNQGQQDDNLQLMITGDRTNFEQGVTQINFGGTGITTSTINVINQTTIVANIRITNDAEPTTRDISVVTGEEVVAFLNAFTVTALIEIDESDTSLPIPEVDKPDISSSTINPEKIKINPGIIELTEKTKQVSETGKVIIVAKRINGSDGKITVKFNTIDGSAESGDDFTAVDDALTWEDGGDKDKEIIISILADENIEEDEIFTLKLTDVTGDASLGLSETEITILDKVVELLVDKEEPNFPPQIPVIAEQKKLPIVKIIEDLNSPKIKLPTEEPNPSIDNDDSIPEKDVPVEIEEITIVLPKPTPLISYTPPCPESNIIYTYCSFQNKEIKDIFISENASVSNAILTGIMENHGWASNLTIEIDAKVTGLNSDNDEIEGVLTGTIINNGTIENIAFHGASISGGTLGGIIFNNSKIDGICSVKLAPDTHIISGILCGEIIGNLEHPAILEALIIKKGSYLENVIIANDVIFEDENQVTIGENVVFLP